MTSVDTACNDVVKVVLFQFSALLGEKPTIEMLTESLIEDLRQRSIFPEWEIVCIDLDIISERELVYKPMYCDISFVSGLH